MDVLHALTSIVHGIACGLVRMDSACTHLLGARTDLLDGIRDLTDVAVVVYGVGCNIRDGVCNALGDLHLRLDGVRKTVARLGEVVCLGLDGADNLMKGVLHLNQLVRHVTDFIVPCCTCAGE